MHLHIHTHMHKIHLLKKELSEVYLNLALQSFAISLIAIFVPIYLLSLGYSLNQVILFFMVYYGFIGLSSPVSAIMAKKFGFKHIILLRTPLLIIFLLGLCYLNTINIPLLFFAVIGGIGSSLYWTAINSIFAKYSNKLHRGQESGKLISIPQLVSIAGPTLGGFISFVYGFNILFLITCAIILISVIPLFFTGESKPHMIVSISNMVNDKDTLKYSMYHILSGPKFIAGTIFWPLFVFWGLNESATGVGFSHTLTGLGVLAFTYYIGKKSDTLNKTSLIKKGALLVALLWFARISANSAAEFFAYSFLAGLFTVLLDVPFLAASFDQANKKNPDEFIVLREIALSIGRVMSLGVLLFISNSILQAIFSFSLAGFATLAFLIF